MCHFVAARHILSISIERERERERERAAHTSGRACTAIHSMLAQMERYKYRCVNVSVSSHVLVGHNIRVVGGVFLRRLVIASRKKEGILEGGNPSLLGAALVARADTPVPPLHEPHFL